MINITNLTYTYPQHTQPALDAVSLHISRGEFVLLAGESGSGKSTLLRCLNGLIPHLSGGSIQGSVSVNNLAVIDVGPQRMSPHVGFVFQNPEAQAVLDRVEPEIAFSLENSPEFQKKRRRESKSEQAAVRQLMQARVDAIIALLDLEHLRQRPLRTLSGGERQKVALACALVLRPSLLVLDEPTSQLDLQAAADLLKVLVDLNQTHGYTIVLAEHRLERILPYVNRVVYLENGRITCDAPPQEAMQYLPYTPTQTKTPSPLDNQALVEITSQKAILAVEDLSFAYDKTVILQDVSLQVNPGELVALVGSNGAGKSTLLRCVVGLLSAQSGEVRINGRSTHKRSIADICREAAYLPQNPDDLLFADSVAAELAITLQNHGMAVDTVAANKLLAQLGLEDVRSSYPRDLSVGQRQRVAFGAVTITEPDLILLDEPTRGLDYGAKMVLSGIWEQWQAQGKGILLVTHDMALVARCAQRVLTLEAGRIQY